MTNIQTEEILKNEIETEKNIPFIHLRCHSQYSILKALPKIKNLINKAVDFNFPSLALTDYNNMYGALEFYTKAKEKNIKPILGVEFDFITEENPKKKYKLILLAKNNLGYKNLLKIVSEVNLKHEKNLHLDKDILKEFLKGDESGIIALSGGDEANLNEYLIKKNFEKAKEIFQDYEKYFGENNFYFEISPQEFVDYKKEILENTIYFVKDFLKKPELLIWTQNPHYLNEGDKAAQKILFNIHGEEEDNSIYQYKFSKNDFSFADTNKTKTLIENLFQKYNLEKELKNFDFIKNNFQVNEKINIEIELGKWHFPDISKDFQKELKAGKTFDDILKDLAIEGIEKRKIIEERKKDVLERLDYELNIIKIKGYAPYFLVVYDLIRYARENGILTNIRGSVAGSMTTYLLQITKCDPLIYQIPFERFLNPERPSAPDIDMDFADDRRDDVINYVRQKYGEKSVAQIVTFGTMQARGAIKDTARAMKYPYTIGDKLSKMVPMPKQGFPVTIDSAINDIEDLKKMYETDRETQTILDMSKKVEGLVRHVGIHAAGVVISPTNITDFSPIQYDPKGERKIITQYDMHYVDETNAGLLKFDFLGIRNLTILKTALNIVRERYDIDLDIENIPLDEEKTFKMLSTGGTMGVFQLASTGMTKFLKDLRPSTIYDINAMVALYRPGPIENIPTYIERKHNPKLVSFLYDDKNLKEILEKTFGVLVYQDDLLLMSIKLAGYSWGEADKFRKAVGKKIPEEMVKQKDKFISGCVSFSKWPQKKAEELWEWIAPFAAYGFNKAHSASYGRVAYQTAFMKANYTIAYMTAILTEESGDIDKIGEIVRECLRLKIKILKPDVNFSFGGFSIVKDEEDILYKENIRFGLYTIKNLGKNIADSIIAERKENGKFKNIEDFIDRIHHKDLSKKSMEALIMCGAMDDFGERNELLFNLENILEYHKKNTKDNKNQNNLFTMFEVNDLDKKSSFIFKKTSPATISQKLVWEKEFVGCYFSGSPLDKWKEKIEKRNVNIENILTEANQEVKDGKNISLPALIEKIKVTKTKNGEYMALLKISDLSGQFEVAVFPKSYKLLKNKIEENKPLLFVGRVASKNEEKTMVIEDIKEME